MGQETNGEQLLSQKEAEVMAMLRLGLTNREIARALSRSEATIKSHVKSILVKTKSRNRAQAASGANAPSKAASPWDMPT